MKGLLIGIFKLLLIVVGIAAVFIFAFRVHVLLGIGLIILTIAAMVYLTRSNIYALRGSARFAKGEKVEALVWFKKAYHSKPCSEKNQIGYGYLLLRSGDLVVAEQVFNQLLNTTKSRETRLQSHCNLATSLWLQGKKNEAVALLEEVYADYKNSLVYGNLGYFKLLQGEAKESLAFNLEAYEYNSDDITILDNVALNYYLLGQFEQANEMFEKLMRKSPKCAESYYFYGLTLKKLGKSEAAREQMNLALSKELAFVTTLTREQMEWEIQNGEESNVHEENNRLKVEQN